MAQPKGKKSKNRTRTGVQRAARGAASSALPVELEALRARALQASLSSEQGELVSSLLDVIHGLTNERAALAAELERSQLLVKKLTFLRYGKKTEKLTRDELAQLVLSFGGSEQEANAPDPAVPHGAAPDEPLDDAPAAQDEPTKTGDEPKKKRKRPNHPGRTTLSPELERVIESVAVPAAERRCVCCQNEMQPIGFVDHERVEYVPAKVVVHVERREKLACRHAGCRCDIATAPRSDDGGSRRRAGASLFAQLVEAKCDDGLPVERQRDQWRRLGFDIPANTLYTYWTYATTLLLPVANIALAQLLNDPVVGVDDTSLPVLDKTRKGGIYKGHLWCFTGTRPLVAYTFTQSWSADEIAPYLAAIEGFVQCDDYKGYSREVTLPDGQTRVLVDPDRRLGCMMHVRRRFHEALKLGDKRAARGVELIGTLYDVERVAKEQRCDPDARLAMRSERSLPVLDQFDTWVDELEPRCLPTSPLGRAVGYAIQQRTFVRRCFSDGRFEIDNGHTERILREPCIGRKNYLFSGSAEAAERLAGAYTLVQSCRLLGFAARDYLIDVLDKLEAGWPMRRIAELVPDRWASEHGRLTPHHKAE